MNLAVFPDRFIVDAGAERNTLACLFKGTDSWMRLPNGFEGDDFAVPLNRALWTVVDSLYSRGAAVDPIVIQEALPKGFQEELEELGGWNYIQTLLDLPLNPLNVEHEARKLMDLSTRRRIESAGNRITELSRDTDTLGGVREKIELAISAIDKGSDSEVTNIATNGYDFIERKMANPTETPGLQSGFAEIDRLTQGFQPGRLYVVGARKKTGKSMLLLNWAQHIAIEQGVPVLWISTEHTIEDEYSRLLALTSEVRESTINDGTFSQVDAYMQRVVDANEKISSSPFHFAYMPSFTLDKLKRLTRKMVRVHGVKALFFDYIKPPVSQGNAAEWQELGTLTYGLKALGGVEDIPVITAVQINREGQQAFRDGAEVDSDHFAGSDRIAQALSVAWVLRRPTDREGLDDEQFRILRCTDNRHGSTNLKLLLDFNGETSKISENRRW